MKPLMIVHVIIIIHTKSIEIPRFSYSLMIVWRSHPLPPSQRSGRLRQTSLMIMLIKVQYFRIYNIHSTHTDPYVVQTHKTFIIIYLPNVVLYGQSYTPFTTILQRMYSHVNNNIYIYQKCIIIILVYFNNVFKNEYQVCKCCSSNMFSCAYQK